MRSHVVSLAIVTIGLIPILGPSKASGQATPSLGGYGGSMASAGGEMGSGGSFIPYGGRFGGFMPSRMSGGGELSFQPRASASMSSGRTAFRLSSMSSGMPSASKGMGGMGGSFSGGPRTTSPMGSKGMGGSAGGMGVMPPSIGYPFRQPPSLIPSLTGGMGMSM